MPFLLAQDLTIDPAQVAQELAKAESVQQVLATIVGVLLLALLAVVIQYVRRERHHETSNEEKAKAATAREDGLRKHYESRIDAERAENKAVMRELNETLKGYTE